MEFVLIKLDDTVNQSDVFAFVNKLKKSDDISFEGVTRIGGYAVIVFKDNKDKYMDDIRTKYPKHHTEKVPHELKDLPLMYKNVDKDHECIGKRKNNIYYDIVK